MPQAVLATRRTDNPRETERATGIVADLWASYQATGSVEARDRLILHYAGLVTYVASKAGAALPSSVDYSDLIQSGIFGLMDAITRFEPERGLKFETYAVTRIRGAMLDELRSQDWAPRSVRKKARDLEAAMDSCRHQLGRAPTTRELADLLDVTPEELHRTRDQVSWARVAPLDQMLSTDVAGERLSLAEMLTDPDAEQPGDALEEQDLHLVLRSTLAELSERNRAVLVHSYIDGMTLAEIGERLGVTESRVCQLRSQALRDVRTSLLARLA